MHKFRRFWLGITKQWEPAWRVRLHDSFSGCEPAVFWMACPFFSWHVENCQRIWCSVRARMCLEENSDNTSESLIAESQRHIWGELRSARFRYSKYCRISTLLYFTPASWDQITEREPFAQPLHAVGYTQLANTIFLLSSITISWLVWFSSCLDCCSKLRFDLMLVSTLFISAFFAVSLLPFHPPSFSRDSSDIVCPTEFRCGAHCVADTVH